MGREAYHRPFVLSELQRTLGGAERFEPPSREAVLERMARYAQRQLAQGDRLSSITRHMLGLYAGEPGARDYRRLLSEGARAAGAGPDLLREAAAAARAPPADSGSGEPRGRQLHLTGSGVGPLWYYPDQRRHRLAIRGCKGGRPATLYMGKDIELAILFADVVGSTRLYELMGDLRARDMVAICIDVMRSATEQRQGTVIKTMGDEVMSTFPSADEALNAAAQMQLQISSHAQLKVDGQPVSIRIGCHFGPVMLENRDVFGATVHTANRMTSQAKAGQIITTAATVEHLSPEWRAYCRQIDAAPIKGQGNEVALYEVLWQSEDVTSMVPGDFDELAPVGGSAAAAVERPGTSRRRAPSQHHDRPRGGQRFVVIRET